MEILMRHHESEFTTVDPEANAAHYLLRNKIVVLPEKVRAVGFEIIERKKDPVVIARTLWAIPDLPTRTRNKIVRSLIEADSCKCASRTLKREVRFSRPEVDELIGVIRRNNCANCANDALLAANRYTKMQRFALFQIVIEHGSDYEASIAYRRRKPQSPEQRIALIKKARSDSRWEKDFAKVGGP